MSDEAIREKWMPLFCNIGDAWHALNTYPARTIIPKAKACTALDASHGPVTTTAKPSKKGHLMVHLLLSGLLW